MRKRFQDTPRHHRKYVFRNSGGQLPERPDRRAFLARSTTLLVASVFSGCGGGGASSSSGAEPTATPPPRILTHPESLTLPIGQSATFQVEAASETPLSYQWLRGNTDIPGATDHSYTTPAVSRADDGSSFSVVVSNLSGSVTSRAAQLNIDLMVVYADSTTITIDSTQITADAGPP